MLAGYAAASDHDRAVRDWWIEHVASLALLLQAKQQLATGSLAGSATRLAARLADAAHRLRWTFASAEGEADLARVTDDWRGLAALLAVVGAAAQPNRSGADRPRQLEFRLC